MIFVSTFVVYAKECNDIHGRYYLVNSTGKDKVLDIRKDCSFVIKARKSSNKKELYGAIDILGVLYSDNTVPLNYYRNGFLLGDGTIYYDSKNDKLIITIAGEQYEKH